MLLRRSAGLLIALGIAAASLFAMLWSESLTAGKTEELRVARSAQRLLEQQISLLKTPGMQSRMSVLEEDLDSVRIRLVEVLTQLPRPASVLAVDYEHTVLSRVFDDVGTGPVRVLRLELRLLVKHAVGFLEMLALIDDAVPVWPHEIQACRIHRVPQERLQVSCAVDFYHWSVDQRQVSAGITLQRPLATELLS